MLCMMVLRTVLKLFWVRSKAEVLLVTLHMSLQLAWKSTILATCLTGCVNSLVLLQLVSCFEQHFTCFACSVDRCDVSCQGLSRAQDFATFFTFSWIGRVGFWMDSTDVSTQFGLFSKDLFAEGTLVCRVGRLIQLFHSFTCI